MTRAQILCGASTLLMAPMALAPIALAQSTGPAPSKEIVVEAPRALPTPATKNVYSGTPIVITTVRITALFGDLDLGKPKDAARLVARIERVAQDACKQLDRLQPFNLDPGCVAAAVARAQPAVDAAMLDRRR